MPDRDFATQRARVITVRARVKAEPVRSEDDLATPIEYGDQGDRYFEMHRDAGGDPIEARQLFRIIIGDQQCRAPTRL